MSAQALINRYAHVMIQSAATHGFDYSAICKNLGLRAETLLSSEHVFGPDSLAHIAREVKLLMQDEFCGFTHTRCKIGTFQLMCELMLSGPTLGASLEKAVRLYSILSDDIRFSLHVQPPLAALQVELTHPEIDRDNFLCEWWLLVWRGLCSWLIGEKIPSLAVQFPHAPAAPTEDYALAFGRACQFLQPYARLSFDAKLLAKPIIRTAEDLHLFLYPEQFDLVSLPGIERTLKAQVKSRMKQQFLDTQTFPSMEDIAALYHMCSQTLRRRLEEEDSSYRAIKEEIRREVVMKWLSNLTISIGEVSRMGGFAESNGLTRAVKAWVGMSPTEYRNSIAEQAQH